MGTIRGNTVNSICQCIQCHGIDGSRSIVWWLLCVLRVYNQYNSGFTVEFGKLIVRVMKIS